VAVENDEAGRVGAHLGVRSDWQIDDHDAPGVGAFADKLRRPAPIDPGMEPVKPVVELAEDGLAPKRFPSARLMAGGDAGLVPGRSFGRPAIKLVFLLGDQDGRAINCGQHLFLRAPLGVIPGL
jgi:hypothetical protein